MTEPILSVRNATKRFGGLVAVNDVSFDVAPGSFLGIAGPNGSGKSTLFNLITGIPYGPTSGEVWFDGQRIDRLGAHQIAARGLTRTFQKDAEYPDLSARDTLLLSATYGGGLSGTAAAQRREAALTRIGLDPARADMPSGELSVYEKKQLMIGSALAMNPKVLMLDEPASGLTKPEIEALDALLVDINQSGVTVLLIEHVLSLLLSVSQHLLVLNQGALLAQGAPDDVIKRPDVIEAYLGGRTE